MKTKNEILKMIEDKLNNSYVTTEEWLLKEHGMKFGENKQKVFNTLSLTAYELLEAKEPKKDFRFDEENNTFEVYVFNETEYPILQYCLNKLIYKK